MDLPANHSERAGLLRSARARLGKWWLIKAVGTMIGMVWFFSAYFWVLRHPFQDQFVMPLTVVDHWIGFWPGALMLYVSLWLYVSLAPALVIDRRELVSLGVGWIVISTIGIGCFFFVPTSIPQPDIDWSEHPSFQFLKSVDLSGNACPSLHVAFAVFSAVWFERLLSQMGAGGFVRAFNWIWCAGILYSTIATRQHVSLDVLAGCVLGLLVGAANMRWLRSVETVR